MWVVVVVFLRYPDRVLLGLLWRIPLVGSADSLIFCGM